MVMEKIMRFQGKGADLDKLSQQIEEQMRIDGYKTQSTRAPVGWIVQAKKEGIMRDIITADRAFSILIAGQPDDFTVHIGVGNWIKNIGIVAVEVLFLSTLFLLIDVPEMLWNQHVENGIARTITRLVESAPKKSPAVATATA